MKADKGRSQSDTALHMVAGRAMLQAIPSRPVERAPMRFAVSFPFLLLAMASHPSFGQTEEKAACVAKLKEVGPVAIRMPYQEFDQSSEGFRKLGNCWAEAAVLLQRYADKQSFEARNVRWHLAQVLAMNGDSAAAADNALLSLRPVELEQKSSFSWNTYALATVAFLRNERPAFDAQLAAQRAATEKHPENQTNLLVLENLAKCFGKSYKDSYPVCVAKP